MVGNSATLKKSGERRCSSRERGRLPLSLSPVVRVAVGTASSIVPLFAAVSSTSFPEIFSKCPRITEVPRCTTSKYGKLWYGSTVKDSGAATAVSGSAARSEEHTSELQSPDQIVCRLLLEKKKKKLVSIEARTEETLIDKNA